VEAHHDFVMEEGLGFEKGKIKSAEICPNFKASNKLTSGLPTCGRD